MSSIVTDQFATAVAALRAELEWCRRERPMVWLASYNPVAYVALCRADRADRAGHGIRRVA